MFAPFVRATSEGKAHTCVKALFTTVFDEFATHCGERG